MRSAIYLLCFAVFAAVLVQTASSNGINTWTELSATGSLTSRTGASASLSGDNIIVFGGKSTSKSGSSLLNDAWSFNLGTSTWSSVANTLVSARTGHTAVTYNGAYVIFGGLETNSTYSNAIWQYKNNQWSQITVSGSSAPTARANHAAVVVGDFMWVFGGADATKSYNDLWKISLASSTPTWTAVTATNPPSERYSTSLVAKDSGDLVVFGGQTASGVTNDVWTFNGTLWTQVTAAATVPSARAAHTAVRVPGGLVVFGGGPSTSSYFGDSWQYIFSSNTWSQLAAADASSAPVSRQGHAAVATSGGFVIFGGSLPHGQFASDVWQAAIGYGLSSSTSGYLTGRSQAASTQFDSTHLYIFGGVDASGNTLGDLVSLNTATQAFQAVTTATSVAARYQAAMATVSAGVLLFGGNDGTTLYNDVWLLTAGDWVKQNVTGAAPAARYGHSAVQESATSIIVFGGQSASAYFNDAWRFTVGSGWTKLTTTNNPPARANHASFLTPSGLGIFGGLVANDQTADAAVQNDMWGLDLSSLSWEPINTFSSPAPRYGHVAAKTVNGVLIIGGFSASDVALNDVWRYDVSTSSFAQLSGLSTTARGYAVAGTASSSVSVFGGANNGVINTVDVINVGGTVYVSTSGSDVSGDGSASKPFATIKQAVSYSSYGGIVIAAGTYTGLGNTNINPRKVVQIAGSGAVTINCGGSGSAFTIDSTATITIAALTITKCSPAIVMIGGVATVSNAVLTANTGNLGGALAVISNGFVQVINSTLSSNTANFGGAVYAEAAAVLVTGSKFTSNTASQSGGAVYGATAATFMATDATFTSNKAANGAAVAVAAQANAGFARASFTSNAATALGGAIHISEASVSSSSSTYTSNTAQKGAAIAALGNNNAVFNEDTFKNNAASVGGAVVYFDTVQPNTNTSTLSGNTAPYGVAAAGPLATLALVSGPSGAVNASSTLPPIVVALHDTLGQVITSDNSTIVTVGLSTKTARRSVRAMGSVLQGTRAVTAVNGVATFDDLSVLADEGAIVNITVGTSSGTSATTINTGLGFVVSACQLGQEHSNGACVNCQPGYYRGLTQDVCTKCPAGAYASASGSTACTDCPAGTFAKDEGSAQCFPCPNGYSSFPGLEACSSCEPGTYSNQIVGVDKCTPCAKGFNASTAGSSECLACPAGTSAPNEKSTVCTACSPGQYAPSGGATQCTPCPAGSFSSYSAASCELCPAGTYSSTPGSPTCSICGYNRVATTPGATSCQSCNICPAGTWMSKTGDNYCPTCTQCGPGTYSPVSSSASCSPCPMGSFSSGYAATTCRKCPVGTFTGSPGSVTCTPCPPKSATNVTGSITCGGCPSNAYAVNGTTCKMCPDGATCSGTNPLSSQVGYYGGPTLYAQCFAKTNCLGNNQCSKGYSGPLCSVCTSGYGRLGTLCIPCLTSYIAGAWVLGVGIALFFIIHMFYLGGRDIRDAQISGKQVNPRTSSLHMLINHLQVMGWLAILKVRWSGPIQLWFFIISAVPVMNLSNFALDCTTHLGFYPQFFFFMLLFIIAMAGVWSVYAIAFYIKGGRKNFKLEDYVAYASTANLYIFRYITPIAMLQIWQTVDCINFDSESYIAQDMRELCHSDVNTAAKGIGMVVFIIFIFALPLYALVKIAYNRKQLRYDRVSTLMAFLWLGFKENRYYYEFINYAKNIILIFFVLLLRKYSSLQQLYSVVWLFIFVLFIFLFMRPYQYPVQNFLEFWALLAQFGTLITGVIYYDVGQQSHPTYVNVDGLFIALNSVVILALILNIWLVQKSNAFLVPWFRWFNGADPKKSYDEEKLTTKGKDEKGTDHNNIILRVMGDGPGTKGGYASSSDYSYSSRSDSQSRSSRSRSDYSSDDSKVRRRAGSPGDSDTSRSRTDSEAGEGRGRRRSLSLDSRSASESGSDSGSEYRRNSARKRSNSSGSEDSQSNSDSSEYGRKGRARSYSSSSAESSSSDDAELRRGSGNKGGHSDEEPLTGTASSKKDKKDANYQDMNIGQLINNIEKLLGTEDK